MSERQELKPTLLDYTKSACDGDAVSIEFLSNWVSSRVHKQFPFNPIQDKEDIAQEVLISLINGFPYFDPTLGRSKYQSLNFNNWVNTIIRNIEIDRRRRTYKAKETEFPNDEIFVERDQNTERFKKSRSEPVGMSILEVVRSILTEAQFEVFEAKCRCKSGNEIVSDLQLPLTTVKGRLRRAIVQIEREILAPAGYYSILELFQSENEIRNIRDFIDNGFIESIQLFFCSKHYITKETAKQFQKDLSEFFQLLNQGFLPLHQVVNTKEYHFLVQFGDKYGVKYVRGIGFNNYYIHPSALYEFRRTHPDKEYYNDVPYNCPEGLLPVSMSTHSVYEHRVVLKAIKKGEIDAVTIKRGTTLRYYVNPDEVRAYLDSRREKNNVRYHT